MRRSAIEEGERWLAQAIEDLRWASFLAREGGWHLACFLAQQVTEKALKAFLYAQGEEIVLGHSVERLCAASARQQPDFAEKARRWSLLDGYYVPTRYPNSLPDGIPANVYTQEAAQGAVALAEEAVTWVKQLLADIKSDQSTITVFFLRTEPPSAKPMVPSSLPTNAINLINPINQIPKWSRNLADLISTYFSRPSDGIFQSRVHIWR